MNKITDVQIERGDSTSLHIQLYTTLYDLIVSGKWSPGSQIPSEAQLSKHLDISRTTVRLALQHAEIEKLIVREPGRGTFVAQQIKPLTNPPKLIAFITNWSEPSTHKSLLTGAESAAKAHNYRIVFCNSRNAAEEQEILQSLIQDTISGVLLWPNANSLATYANIFDQYQQRNIPIVCMDRPIQHSTFDCVTSDNYDSSLKLMSHLLALGHCEIAFLSHRQMGIQPVKERYQAYQDAMQQAGLSPHTPLLIGPENQENAEALEAVAYQNDQNQYTRELINIMQSTADSVTAIFAVNNIMALFAIRVLHHLEIKIPEEMSVACFDDTDAWLITNKPLTTVVQDMHRIGQRAIQHLIRRMEGYSGPPAYDVVPSQLVIRQSTSVPVRSIFE